MNKKIASEFAIGVIILLAIVVAGISWLNSVKINNQLSDVSSGEQFPRMQEDLIGAEKNDLAKTNPEISQDSAKCTPRYYEGKNEVSGWFVSESEDAIIIAISKDEISKLPIALQKSNEQGSFTVKLVDSTKAVKKELMASSEKKPATITIQGYAEVCQQSPLVSLEKATTAFKGRS